MIDIYLIIYDLLFSLFVFHYFSFIYLNQATMVHTRTDMT